MRHFEDAKLTLGADDRRRRLTRSVERMLSMLIIGVWAIGVVQYAYVAGIVQ